jgi:hypothetical protein
MAKSIFHSTYLKLIKMKFLLKTGMAVFYTLSSINGIAQIKNPIVETVSINGNCGMCKATIEKAGNLKNIASINWNKDTKSAVITYDKTRTTSGAILKKIALAGYDSEQYLAPDEAYAALPSCCQYARSKSEAIAASPDGHSQHEDIAQTAKPLDAVYDHYFALKDALVATDSKAAAKSADALLKAIDGVDMKKLDAGTHEVWMGEMKNLKTTAAKIARLTAIEQQRLAFMDLAEPMRILAKVDAPGTFYYQHCPMANGGKGAEWLSRENPIKNPYYGAQMLTCGKTVETIK